MRTAAGFAGFHLLLALSGACLLHALGLVRATPRALAAAAGPAYLAGVALVIPVQIALTVAGVPLGLASFVAIALGSAALALAAGRAAGRVTDALRPTAPGVRPARDRFDTWAVRIGAGLLAVYVLVGTRAFAHLPTITDDANIWSTKALALFFYGSLDVEVFKGPAYGASHLDYPILQPLLEADLYRAMGRFDLQLAHVELWIVFGAFLWTVGFLLAERREPLGWLVPMAALAAAPGVYEQVKIGYADITVSCFGGAGVLCIGLWLERRRLGHLVLGAVFLVAAASTKNEGAFVLAAAFVVAAATLGAGREWRALRPLAAAAGLGVVLVLPWRLWVASLGSVPSDLTPLGEAASPSFLIDRLDRLNEALEEVGEQLAHQGRWLWLLPAGIAVVLVAIARGRDRRIAAFYLATGLLVISSVLWVFWTGGPPDVGRYLAATADRVVSGTIFLAALALAHLASGERLREPGRGERDSSSAAAPGGP